MITLIKIVSYIMAAFTVFHLATKKYLNPYKLIFIFGKKGSGKTTTLTKLALQHLKAGWDVYCTIDIPGCKIFDVQDIGRRTFPENSCILIDEVGMIWDNRDFKNFRTDVRDYFKYQRQYKNKVILCSQVFDIDIKLRSLCDELYLMQSFMRVFSIRRRIIKKITIKECADGTSTLSDDYKFDSPLFGGIKFTYIPRYVAYFKSYDPKKLAYIDSEYLDFNDIQLRYLSNKNFVIDKIKIMLLHLISFIKNIPSRISRFILKRRRPPGPGF